MAPTQYINRLSCADRENRTLVSSLARTYSTTKPYPLCLFVHPPGLEPRTTVPKTDVISISPWVLSILLEKYYISSNLYTYAIINLSKKQIFI